MSGKWRGPLRWAPESSEDETPMAGLQTHNCKYVWALPACDLLGTAQKVHVVGKIQSLTAWDALSQADVCCSVYYREMGAHEMSEIKHTSPVSSAPAL